MWLDNRYQANSTTVPWRTLPVSYVLPVCGSQYYQRRLFLPCELETHQVWDIPDYHEPINPGTARVSSIRQYLSLIQAQ